MVRENANGGCLAVRGEEGRGILRKATGAENER